MSKPRKMLGSADAPYILSLMRLIDTQSKATIAAWALDYAEAHILPIYVKHFLANKPYNRLKNGPKNSIRIARAVLDGHSYPKSDLHNCCNYSDRELGHSSIAQIAARTCGQACSSVYFPSHSLGLAFYGAAAIAYDRVGLDETPEVYDKIAAEECAKMEAALRAVAVEDEPNPAKINWGC